MMRTGICLLALLMLGPWAGPAGAADGPFKVNSLKEEPPKDLAPPVRESLASQGFRVLDSEGAPVFDLWLRKAVPAAAKPAGPKGPILFPVLAEGELLGLLRWHQEGHDYRDQAIAKGLYTLRYGLQPLNGDHLGTSPNRDYALALLAAKDKAIAALPYDTLKEKSSEAAGTSHPAVHMLLAPPSGSSAATVRHDQEKNLWGLVIPLELAVKGESKPATLPIEFVFMGAAAP